MSLKLKKKSNLWSLTKIILLKRIKKYEKKNNINSNITMKSKKEEMINYILKNIPQKKVSFAENPKIIKIENRTEKEREERKKYFHNLKEKKKIFRIISKINYKHLPTMEEYIELKKYNKNKKNKLKKKKPIKFIKFKVVNIGDEIMYNLMKDKTKIILEIFYTNKKGVEEMKQYFFKFKPKNKESKYRAEYKAKIKLIKTLRKIMNIK